MSAELSQECSDYATSLRSAYMVAGLEGKKPGSMLRAADLMERAASALAPLPSERPEAEDGWQPIETAPKGANGVAFMHLAWGAEGDESTGSGMRIGDSFFAVGVFYCLGQTKAYEFREIEVKPTHWMRLPALAASQGAKE